MTILLEISSEIWMNLLVSLLRVTEALLSYVVCFFLFLSEEQAGACVMGSKKETVHIQLYISITICLSLTNPSESSFRYIRVIWAIGTCLFGHQKTKYAYFIYLKVCGIHRALPIIYAFWLINEHRIVSWLGSLASQELSLLFCFFQDLVVTEQEKQQWMRQSISFVSVLAPVGKKVSKILKLHVIYSLKCWQTKIGPVDSAFAVLRVCYS